MGTPTRRHHRDGSITGDVAVALKGMFAVNSRARLRHLPKDQEEELVKNVFKSSGYIGSGQFDKEDPTELLDTYAYKVKFELKEFMQWPGAGAFGMSHADGRAAAGLPRERGTPWGRPS